MSVDLSVVAIIGRPNVGKSTLFNRITGTRRAIMEETAGVTRDRIYGRAEWEGIVFDVVDTGGLENPPEGDEIRNAMMDQTRAAIEEADVLIALFDGTKPLLPADHDLIELLRDVKKPVFYTANKIDHQNHEAGAYEIYESGIDKLYLLSAEHGRLVGDLLDELVEVLPRQVLESELAEEETGPIRIAVVGRPNAGKSSIVNGLLGSERLVVSEVPGTTRDVVDSRLEIDGQAYLLLDTAGIRRKSKTHEKLEKFTVIKALQAVRRSDIVCVTLDATRGIGEEQDAKIAGYVQDAYRGVVVLVNKWDLKPASMTTKKFEDELRYQIKFLPFASVLFVSAETGSGIDAILPAASAAFEQYGRRIPTAEVNKVIRTAVDRSPPPSPGGRHVKIRFATQVSTRPPTFVIVVNRPKDVHITYRRYITNKLYEAFGFAGTPLRVLFKPPKGRYSAAEKFG